MTWRAYLIHTMDGRVGAQLDLSGGTIKSTLNDIEDITVVASEASLDGVERSWWSPWAGGVLVTHEDEWTSETPVAAGPIIRPVEQDRRAGTITIKAAGIGAVLQHRIVTDRDYGPGEGAALAGSTISWTGVDLGTIVARIIRSVTSKRAGWLPIVLPAERPGTRERTAYDGFNVANNVAWKRIVEITEVIGGPDVMLRPRWSTDRRIEWELVTGTEDQPTLPQEHRLVWDSTARDSPVASIDVVSDAHLANRVYATGAGEGAGIILRISEVTPPVHMPLLEAVVTQPDSEDPIFIREQARAGISTQALDQVSMRVHSTAVAPMVSWRVGDAVTLVADGWLNVPDGRHDLRLIHADYDLASEAVQVECQDDVLGEEMSW